MKVNWIGLYTFIRRDSTRFARVPIQTLVAPWISAILYIFIFGSVVGKKIDLIAGVQYIDFVLPGILMMNIMMAAFSQTSSSLYFQRFARHIEEILVAPLSHLEMVVGYVVSGIVRGLVVGFGIYVIAILFSAATVANLGLFLFYVVSVSVIFSLIGIIVGLWAEQFEHLQILNVFVIMPLSFLGGVFNSITMLPEAAQTIVRFNPLFYLIDGIRYSMIGISESNVLIGFTLIIGSMVVLTTIVLYLFHISWKLRE